MQGWSMDSLWYSLTDKWPSWYVEQRPTAPAAVMRSEDLQTTPSDRNSTEESLHTYHGTADLQENNSFTSK